MQNDNTHSNSRAIPKWMLGSDAVQIKINGKARSGFLRKTLSGISKVFQNELLSERFAVKRGLLQLLDARVKLLTILFFMIISGITGSLLTLIFLFAIALMMVKLSQLDMLRYFKRVWLLLPLILLVASIPAATNIFIKGNPLIYIHSGLYFSLEGIKAIVKISVRMGVSISFGYVLIMTTRWSQLTKSLKVLRIPKLIISILDMTYRYIFVLAKISIEMFEARFLRTVGRISGKENRKFVSNSMAFLFIKSSFISEEIFDAMVCRGYTGNPVSLSVFKVSKYDFIWLCNVGAMAVLLLLLQ